MSDFSFDDDKRDQLIEKIENANLREQLRQETFYALMGHDECAYQLGVAVGTAFAPKADKEP